MGWEWVIPNEQICTVSNDPAVSNVGILHSLALSILVVKWAVFIVNISTTESACRCNGVQKKEHLKLALDHRTFNQNVTLNSV